MSPTCSIFFHNYYGDHEKWLRLFTCNIKIPFILYYNIVEDSIYNRSSNISELETLFNDQTNGKPCHIVIRNSCNKGKDIGGKLVLLDSSLKLQTEGAYGLFLHDKKSPYKSNGQDWADQFLKITEPGFIQQVTKIFDNDGMAGIVAASGTIINEYDPVSKSFVSTNNLLLWEQMNLYNLHPEHYSFVAGTMFWFRLEPMNLFFKKNHPLEIRKLFETGNVLDEFKGTYTHCWERLLSWIITTKGFKICVI
jgi:lipopolysaccharide biosynthesis protein